MSFKLCIAEKPSVAKDIAKILGANSRKDGYLEGNGYQVTWTFGHLCELKMPEDYNPIWKKWQYHDLPILPDKFDIKVKSGKGVKSQFNTIKKLAKSATLVINCGDAGQEGELIQRWVLRKAGYKGPVQRLWISSLTTQSIKSGFAALRPAADFDRLYHAGFARSVADWILGINATRLYTLKYGGYKQLLSIGRVQTPTLALIVNRQEEIDSFVPESFWELKTTYKEVIFSSELGKMFKQEDADQGLNTVTGHPLQILDSDRKLGRESPPRLYDLTSLQIDCNRIMGLSASNALKIIQTLYEKKLITYPRVDTTYLPDDQYHLAPGVLQNLTGAYAALAAPLLQKPLLKRGSVFNSSRVTDHHAIIPTGSQPGGLSPTELKIYDLITRRYIAAFYPDCEFYKTIVTAVSNEIGFKATGKEISDEGWQVVIPPQKKKSDDDEDNLLPPFQAGESGPHEPFLLSKKTSPPKSFTEGSLLKAMETAGKMVDDEELRELMKANGIGRPSTRAAIIETLVARNFIVRERKKLVPTDVGKGLIAVIRQDLLKSAEMTGIWEKKIRDIESGEYQVNAFVNEMKQMVSLMVAEMKTVAVTAKLQFTKPEAKKYPVKSTPSQAPKAVSSSTPGGIGLCPKCKQGQVVTGKSAWGCLRFRDGCDFRMPFDFLNKTISESQAKKILKTGKSMLLKGFSDNGVKINGRLTIDAQCNLKIIPEASSKKEPEANRSCPACQKGTIVKGSTAYGCSRWQAGCTFRFPFDQIRALAGKKKITPELILKIIHENKL